MVKRLTVYRPSTKNIKGVVIAIPGFGSNRAVYKDWANVLTGKGYVVAAADPWWKFALPWNRARTANIVGWKMHHMFNTDNIWAMGRSMGGTGVLRAKTLDDRFPFKGTIAIVPWVLDYTPWFKQSMPDDKTLIVYSPNDKVAPSLKFMKTISSHGNVLLSTLGHKAGRNPGDDVVNRSQNLGNIVVDWMEKL